VPRVSLCWPSRAYRRLEKAFWSRLPFGRSVVASDLGSRRELIHENETGLLFPPGDVGRLTEKFLLLHDRTTWAAQMGAAGRELVQKQHSPETHYVALMELYGTWLYATKSRSSIRNSRETHLDYAWHLSAAAE